MMIQRSVFSNGGVDIAQPQLVEVNESIETIGEEKQEVVKEATVDNEVKEITKPKPIKKKVEKTNIKDITQDKLIVGSKEFLIRSGYDFFTINANVKIGDDKFNIQRVVQEKNEKLANIEYDRIIKKEFGKPKSVTGRTIRKYQDGDEEFMTINEEKKIPERKKSQEEIDLENKIQLLTTDVMGLFKVTFSTKYIKTQSATQYVFAQDIDGVYEQLDMIEERQEGECNQILSNNVKQIIKMNANAIKMDKACLKHLLKYSVDDIQEMYDNTVQINKEQFDKAVETYKELVKNGFQLYIGKILPKEQIMFAELARSDKEMNALIFAEDRMHQAMLGNQKITGVNVGTVRGVLEKTKSQDIKEIDNAERMVKEIQAFSKKEDIVYHLLFEKQDVKSYIKYVEEITNIKERISNGEKDILLKELTEERAKELGGIDKLVDSLIQIDKKSGNIFGGNRGIVRSLLDKVK